MLEEASEAGAWAKFFGLFRPVDKKPVFAARILVASSEDAGKAPPQVKKWQLFPVDALFSIAEVVAARRLAIEVRMGSPFVL